MIRLGYGPARIVSQIFRDHLERLSSDVGAMYIEAARDRFGEAGAWGAAFMALRWRELYRQARAVDDAYLRTFEPLLRAAGGSGRPVLNSRGARLARRIARTARAASRAWQEAP